MRINIPSKLEKHKELIKKYSERLVHSQKLELICIGGNQKENHYKEIYLCYNPYSTSIKLDINHFNKDKNIYKMYPPSIKIPPKEVFAFLTVSSEKKLLLIDEEYLLFYKKQRINQLINEISSLNKKEDLEIFIEEYNPEINSTLLIDEISNPSNKIIKKLELDKTQHLEDFDPDKLEEEFKYIRSNPDNINVKLNNLEYNPLTKKHKIVIEFINKSETENYEILGFIINLYDKENKHGYQIRKKIKLKHLSKKKVSFSLDKHVFDNFIIQDLKIKVSF